MTEEKVHSDHAKSDHEATCHHHSWLGKHFCTRNFKKLGMLGVVLFVLHILFHIVEILLIPAILVWLGLN